jgi:hypothetical protein
MKRFLPIPLALFGCSAYCADFTTYIGDENPYQVAAVAADSAGNTYVTGARVIVSQSGASADDVFVTKLDVAGGIVFTTTFGGKGNDQGQAIALDAAGNIWVGGSTSSNDFPLHDALVISPSTGFLVELAPDGTVIYSSYLAGVVNGIATDSSGNVYLTGATSNSAFPTTAGLPNTMVGEFVGGAFVTKLDPTGSRIIYSGLIAGAQADCDFDCANISNVTYGVGIVLDQAGDLFVAGNSTTADLPISSGGIAGYGAFVASINAAGNKLIYLTYLGPPAGEISAAGPAEAITASDIAVDAAGDAYLTGFTADPNLPTTSGAYQTTLAGDPTQTSDTFAVKLNPTGAIAWATYLGPAAYTANSIALDAAGDVWLVGTNGAGFASASPGYVAAAGDFLAELSPDGSKLVYTAEFPSGTEGQALAIDSTGVFHVSGSNGIVSSITPSAPIASSVFGIMNAAGTPIAGRIAPGEVISIFGFGLGPATGASATPSNGRFPTTVAGVQVLVNGAAIPLLYVSSSQINAEIPAPPNGIENNTTTVQVINGSATLPSFRVMVDDQIFGVFKILTDPWPRSIRMVRATRRRIRPKWGPSSASGPAE